MAIITVPQLNRFMSSPQWTEEQQLAALDVIEGVEGKLEGALFQAYITPRAMAEVAPILRSGLVATAQPVFSVSKVDGVVVDSGHPLLSPWVHTEHRLRHLSPPLPAPSGYGYGFGVTPTAWGGANVPYVDAVGQVEVFYQGGWGDLPALRLAILTKSQALMLNRHDDSITARNMNAERAPYVVPEEWTEVELKPLGIFRNLTAAR